VELPSQPTSTDPNVAPEPAVRTTTLMNWILPVDLDGDARADLVVPLDRSRLSGLTNDALVWFENLR